MQYIYVYVVGFVLSACIWLRFKSDDLYVTPDTTKWYGRKVGARNTD